MRYPMYCIRDRKGDFWQPKVQMNEASAIREFAQLVNTPNTIVDFAPADFELCQVGYFDTEKGLIDSDSVVVVCSGDSLVRSDSRSLVRRDEK